MDDVHTLVHLELLEQSIAHEEIDRGVVAAAVEKIAPLLDTNETAKVVERVLSAVNGLGLLDPFLADSSVNDVMVIGDRGVWIERAGRVIDTGVKLRSSEVEHLAERVVAPLGLRVDRASPMVDARLADGSRVNVVLAPLAVDGPCLTIRRFVAKAIPIEHFADDATATMLRAAVVDHRTILVSGGTGAGKTTLLNTLAGFVDPDERIVTIEDTAELRLPMRHVVRLEARPANSEGVGLVSIRDLVRNALRMRPDRIVVGEVRGPEALDMLQAINTGHVGSMSTCHANTALDALRRIETMVLMSDVELPLTAVRSQIARAFDLVVHVVRTKNGGRKVAEVVRVQESDHGYATVGARS